MSVFGKKRKIKFYEGRKIISYIHEEIGCLFFIDGKQTQKIFKNKTSIPI